MKGGKYKMPKSDHEYFNCSEEHEATYVANLYTDPVAVKEFLKIKCKAGIISNSTHAEVYKLLATNGFTRK